MRSCLPSRRELARRRPAFTLMEVLLVLVILVILGSFAVGMFVNTRKSSQVKQATIQINAFKGPLNEYNLEVGVFPTTAQGLESLRTAPADLRNPAKWHAFLDAPVPVDPWGNPYQYQCPGNHNVDGFDIWSFGPDGQNGTADDISNWSQGT